MGNSQRPVYLNLFAFSFPITAIVSILHRVTGLLLFLFIPVFLAALQNVLFYMYVPNTLGFKIVVWLALTSLIYHLFAGIRHLCMDLGFAESKKSARITAYLLLITAMCGSVIVWLHL